MFQMSLITSVLVWERILEIENEKRQSTRYEDVFTHDLGTQRGQGIERNVFDFTKAKLPARDCCSHDTFARSHSS
jgi:hypothetical protein